MTDIIKPRYAMDKHDIDAFVRSRMYLSNIVICDELGIHESTFYRLLRDNPYLPMVYSLAIRGGLGELQGYKTKYPKR
jgi:hypothetical protein